jgi:hypothetical protein
MRNRMTLLLGSLFLGMGASGYTIAGPVHEAVSLKAPGLILKKDFHISRCDAYLMGITFSTKDLSEEEERRLIGDGMRWTGTNEPVHPGITVPLRVTLKKINKATFSKPRDILIFGRDIETKGVSSFSPTTNRTVSRSTGSITLKPGTYQLEVQLLGDVGQLSDRPTFYWVGSTFKIGPGKHECS